MNILTLDEVSLAYGHRPLLDKVTLQVSAGERICLVGRNGAGKSTLFRLISGHVEPDDGAIWRRDVLRISYLEQEVPADAPQTIYELVAAGVGQLGRLLTDYHNASQRAGASDGVSLGTLSDLQQRIEVRDGWNLEQKVETVLTRLSLPADARIAECSGGIRRRAMLAQALVSDPDLLLLDEPTNHMDIAAITWLEEFLLSFRGSLIFVTHDRTLLKHIATRIIELDRGCLTSFPGDFDHYLERKEQLLEIEQRSDARFDKKLAEEEAWIRQGIKARRTRNEGRVRRLEAMRRARGGRAARQGEARFDVDAGELSGKLVVDLRNVDLSLGGRPVVRDVSTRILRGDRVGIIGPNGCGKTTLLRLILGEVQPDRGRVVLGARLEAAYFDQQRQQLDPDASVRDNISEGRDYIDVRGRSRHVISYLKEFLFSPQRIDSPVSSLSGGERNRLLLARLFTHPANLMVLDEPTNDLDVETLELLEELLGDYDGTLLLVSHDRTFLDNLVTSTLVFEGDGRVAEYVGGYEDWLRQRRPRTPAPESPDRRRAATAPARDKKAARAKKLGYMEKRELESLPEKIEDLEQTQGALEAQMSDADFYRQDKAGISATMARLERIREELARAYERWEHLDTQARLQLSETPPAE